MSDEDRRKLHASLKIIEKTGDMTEKQRASLNVLNRWDAVKECQRRINVAYEENLSKIVSSGISITGRNVNFVRRFCNEFIAYMQTTLQNNEDFGRLVEKKTKDLGRGAKLRKTNALKKAAGNANVETTKAPKAKAHKATKEDAEDDIPLADLAGRKAGKKGLGKGTPSKPKSSDPKLAKVGTKPVVNEVSTVHFRNEVQTGNVSVASAPETTQTTGRKRERNEEVKDEEVVVEETVSHKKPVNQQTVEELLSVGTGCKPMELEGEDGNNESSSTSDNSNSNSSWQSWEVE